MNKNNNRRRNFRKNNKKRFNNDYPKKKIEYPTCPICNSKINDIYSAISYGEDNLPAHFDCILKELSEKEELMNKEKICYLGGGSFGIVKFSNTPGSNRFFVRKRIQYEKKDEAFDWRKDIGFIK